MYERSAIVLERYLDKIFGFDKEANLKENVNNFNDLVNELKQYQTMVTEEERVIEKFDDIATQLQAIQKSQEKLCLTNQKLEDERNKLFNDLDENPNTVQTKLEKIEYTVEKNNNKLKELREEYIKTYVIFIERQKERNKFARGKRNLETNHMTSMKLITEKFQNISVQDVQKIKKFLKENNEEFKTNIIDIMIRNGKNEKIGFNEEVIDKAVRVRIDIAEKEAECYILLYDKFSKILKEIESDSLKLEKYEKVLRDNSVKLTFLNAEKNYIVEFLDNERMTAISGSKAHKKMMEEACENFELDINQINNLYELILKEIAGKSTKKAYKELYNKTYLKEIQDKEKNFEKEITNIKINMGTVINSNYWRIEGIKNVYEVFIQEVTEKFEKDLSDYQVEEIENFQENTYDDNDEKYEADDDYDYEEYDDEEYDDDEYEYEYDDEYEYEDDDEYEYEDEDYEDEDDEEYDDDDEYEDEDYEDEDDDEYDDDDEYEDDEYDDEEYEEYDDNEYDDNEYDKIKPSKKQKTTVKESKKQTKKSNSKKDNSNIFNKLFKKNDKQSKL